MEPKQSDLIDKAGISQTYASLILNGKRAPSRALAIHIFRTTGWRHHILADLSDDQISMLEAIEPWTPRIAA
jgi:transcriptional regulator with XRE-family HTH domain